MKRALIAVIVAVSFHLTSQAQGKPARLADLGWMAGCWESKSDTKGRVFSEQWMKPAGGIMIGMGRTLQNGKPADWEFMRIEQQSADLVFIAHPKANKEETPFKMIEMNAGRIVFENATHDFPQRVLYAAVKDGLMARIEGTNKGKFMGMDFPMVRVKCEE